MRVIAGSARSIMLIAPEDKVRPTTDRTKETLFNIIAFSIPGATVLDLFAGSGALGIEALSRGADFCDFVDMYEGSIDCIKKNLSSTKLIDKSRVLKYDYSKACQELWIEQKKYDLIFLDPPYCNNLENEAIVLIVKYNLLSPIGKIIVESDIKESIRMDLFDELEVYKEKVYKTNKFTFIQRKGGLK